MGDPHEPLLSRALAALAGRKHELLTLTEQLVRVNSFTGNVPGVNAVGQLLRAALSDTQLALAQTPGGRTGDHLTFSTDAAARAPAILLIGHHDTVFPPGAFETYEVDGDTARGPGVLDMKGGLAIVICVLRALSDAGLLAQMPLCFVSVGDEEVGSPSSHPLLEQLARGARAGLVFEAGRAGDAVITARRGSGNAIVTAHGKAAHAGNALASGRNAIWALAKFIDLAQLLTDEARGLSVNVGLVRGGTSRNTVPAQAQAELDLRFSDAEGERYLTVALAQAAALAEAYVPGSTLDVQVEISRKPWSRGPAHEALCARYLACQLEAGLAAAEAPPMGGGSDANTVAATGLACIDGLGPRGTGFHTLDEQISIASLSLKAEALLRFLVRELCDASA